MSSSDQSGAPAEATATTPAPEAAFPSFGNTRGSGLARGKRPAAAAAASTAASSDYKPTAIEVVTAPREYQNPFAPVETPAAVVAPELVVMPAPAPAPVAPVAPVKPYVAPAAAETPAPAPAPAAVEPEAPASLNILEPLQPKTVPAQTWESEGFRPSRAERPERESRPERAPRREEPRREAPAAEDQAPAEPFDISSIPAKFLYVRPGYNYVPTPSNYGGAPRDRAPRGEGAPASSSAPAPRSSEAPKHAHRSAPASQPAAGGGGFMGWLKGLFGSAPEAPAAATESHRDSAGSDRPQGQHRGGGHRSRGGQGQGQGGGYQGGGDGQRRRSRGGRGRSGGGGSHRGGGEGSQQGGSI